MAKCAPLFRPTLAGQKKAAEIEAAKQEEKDPELVAAQ
jgi:hypothetical protein